MPPRLKARRHGTYLITEMRQIIGLFILTAILGCTTKTTKQNDFKQIYFRDTISTDKLKEIDYDQLKKWGYDTVYRRYFYYQELGGQHKSLVIKVTGDDYHFLTLLTFDHNNKLVDDYKLSGSNCSGPDCPFRESVMTNENEFLVREIQEFSDDSVRWVTSKIDTTQWTIKIDQNHKVIGKR